MRRSEAAATTLVAVCITAAALLPPGALAQEQTKGQQKCLDAMIKSARKVAGTTAKEAARCVSLGAKNKLPSGVTAQQCLTDDLKGKIAKAQAKLDAAAAKRCGGSNTPDFAYIGSAAVNDAHQAEMTAFVSDNLGPDLDATLASSAASDPGARCSGGVIKLARKLADTMHKEFRRCAKSALRDGTAIDPDGFADCLDALTDDAKGKIEKATAKILKTLDRKCPAPPTLGTLFPGFDGVDAICDRLGFSLPLDAASVAQCSELRMRCRVCRAVGDAHGLSGSCDLFDNGTIDGTCPGCLNGVVDEGEDCDGTDCCASNCTFEPAGTACTGTAGSCATPECDGAGTCAGAPLPDGTACENGDECTLSSVCSGGVCVEDEPVAPGEACRWAVIGSSLKNTDIRADSGPTVNSGDVCGFTADIGVDTVLNGDLVTTGVAGNGRSIDFGQNVTIDSGDIVTNNGDVQGNGGADLPGLAPGTDFVAAGQVVAKDPPPTVYDTTGSDPRIAECQDAQADLLAFEAELDGLAQTSDLGSTYEDLPSGPAPPIVAVNPGALNVFDMTHITGTAPNVIIDLDGGGNADTVFVLRVATRINTSDDWTFNLINGLTADNLVIYGKSVSSCVLQPRNVGGGTLFCPNTRAQLSEDSEWSGAIFGGAGGTTGRIRLGFGAELTRIPFTGF